MGEALSPHFPLSEPLCASSLLPKVLLPLADTTMVLAPTGCLGPGQGNLLLSGGCPWLLMMSRLLTVPSRASQLASVV